MGSDSRDEIMRLRHELHTLECFVAVCAKQLRIYEALFEGDTDVAVIDLPVPAPAQDEGSEIDTVFFPDVEIHA